MWSAVVSHAQLGQIAPCLLDKVLPGLYDASSRLAVRLALGILSISTTTTTTAVSTCICSSLQSHLNSRTVIPLCCWSLTPFLLHALFVTAYPVQSPHSLS